MAVGYMHRRDELRSGERTGMSVLSTPSQKPFSDASFPRGKGRVRGDQGLSDPPPVYGAPAGELPNMPPQVGPPIKGLDGRTRW
jgi:hypothetical protein